MRAETIDRRAAVPPEPRVEDATGEIGDLLPELTDDVLRASYLGETMPITLGLLRARERFPRSSRFHTRALRDWELRTRVTVSAPEAFDVFGDPAIAPLMPYAALSLHAFGRPLRSVVVELHRRLQLDPRGFAVLWIGSGGHVTPLHHDGDLVHGRWHLVVRGAKQFDFVPPGSRHVPRLPWWDLHRRFSALYKAPLPDRWLTDGTGAHRFHLGPGQMVTWARRWWHRVEIARSGVTIGLSTRGRPPERRFERRAIAHLIESRIVGEVEHYLDALDEEPPGRTLEELRALARSAVDDAPATAS